MRLEGVLRRVTALLVQACEPKKIILFGSHARGQENADSDLDILLIGRFHESPFLRGRELREIFHRYPLRIDLHVMTPEEVAVELSKPLGFVNSVMDSGIVLYSRGEERFAGNTKTLMAEDAAVHGNYCNRLEERRTVIVQTFWPRSARIEKYS